MNNFKKLKKLYDRKGWVVCKKLFSLNEIKAVNKFIDNFLKKEISSIKKKTRVVNFVNKKT